MLKTFWPAGLTELFTHGYAKLKPWKKWGKNHIVTNIKKAKESLLGIWRLKLMCIATRRSYLQLTFIFICLSLPSSPFLPLLPSLSPFSDSCNLNKGHPIKTAEGPKGLLDKHGSCGLATLDNPVQMY